MPDVRIGGTREEDLVRLPAFDCVEARMLSGTVDKLEDLVLSWLVDGNLAYLWIRGGSREDDLLANIAYQAEADSTRRNIQLLRRHDN